MAVFPAASSNNGSRGGRKGDGGSKRNGGKGVGTTVIEGKKAEGSAGGGRLDVWL